MTNPPLFPDAYYHVYTHAVGQEYFFREARNYRYFLQRYTHYILPIAETFAYCLLPTHMHFLIRVREHVAPQQASRAWSNLFNAYTKAFNLLYQRRGSLFQRPFGRRRIESQSQLIYTVIYIHRNPQKHGVIADFRRWSWSSYPALQGQVPTHLVKQEVWGWFGGREAFINAHKMPLVGETKDSIDL